MTTPTMSLLSESVQIGQPYSTTTSGGALIVSREFNAARPEPLANTQSIDSVIAGYQKDATKAALIAEARRQLADLYPKAEGGLCRLRLKAGLSQGLLAERAKTSQSHIARIEHGKIDPGTDVIVRIAAALSISPGEVFEAVLQNRTGPSEARA